MTRLIFAAALILAAAPAGARRLDPEIVKVDLDRARPAAPETLPSTVVVSTGAAAGFAALPPSGAWMPKGFRTISYMPGEEMLP